MQTQTNEKGQASIFIDLTDSKVSVYHGEDKTLLFQSGVKKGYWDNLWETIRRVKQ